MRRATHSSLDNQGGTAALRDELPIGTITAEAAGVGLSLSNEEPVAKTLAMAASADELGYDEVSIPESRLFRSATSVAAAILVQTSRVTVRVGVVNPVTRHPLLLALEAATLDDLAPGRVRFGIGAAEWTMHAFGAVSDDWRAYSNTVEAVRAVRSLLAGRSLGFGAETFSANSDLSLDLPAPTQVPVDVGAVNARMLIGGRGVFRRCSARSADEPFLCGLGS